MDVSFVLSLESFERNILDEFISVFPRARPQGDSLDSDAITELIENWDWAREVLGDFDDAFLSQDLIKHVQGDRTRSWRMFLELLVNDQHQYRHYRTDTLKSNNPTYPARLIEAEELTTARGCPLQSDNWYWNIVDELYLNSLYGRGGVKDLEVRQLFPKLTESITAGLTNEVLNSWSNETFSQGQRPNKPKFDIFSLVRMNAIYERRPDNLESIERCLEQNGFYDIYCVSSGGGFVHASKSGNDLEMLFIIDPAKWIEYIPFEELQISGCIHRPDDKRNLLKAHWTSKNTLSMDHHLRTEEGVFRFCVNNSFTFPGHLENGHVCFVLTPLKDTLFISQLTDFWATWNDCAVTQNPETNEWILLETLPGTIFRKLKQSRSTIAALKYFRNVVDRFIEGDESESLQAVLGLEFQPQYENLMRLIPPSQITNIDPNPIGQGARGTVYRASWLCPGRFETRTPEERPVALKYIPDLNGSRASTLIKELDITFAALSGNPVGCIEFYGITKSPSAKDDLQNRDSWATLIPNSTLLVFQYAEHGSLLTYLETRFDGSASDWAEVFEALTLVAEGLSAIHKLNIIHRDLHWGNVLVRERPTPSDPVVASVISPCLSDLGEGKSLTSLVPLPDASFSGSTRSGPNLPGTTTSIGASVVGNRDFRAPEVQRGAPHSAASDVYALGKLTSEMVALHWDRAASAAPGEQDAATMRQTLPAWLLQAVQDCLQEDPARRPSAKALVTRLDNFEIDHPGEGGGVRYDADLVVYDEETVLRMTVISGGSSLQDDTWTQEDTL